MKVEWGGMSVELVCGLSAMEEVERELGSLQAMFDNLQKKTDLEKTVLVLFRAMARCGYEAAGVEPDVIMIGAMGGWLSKESLAADRAAFARNRDAVLKCLHDGFDMKYTGKGGKKDKYTREAEARIARKKAKKTGNVLTANSLYSDALICGISLREARVLTPAFVREMITRRTEYLIDINPLSHIGQGVKRNRGR